MTIYIVQEVYYDWYRFDTVVGVFSDEDKAKEFARAKANESKYGDRVEFSEGDCWAFGDKGGTYYVVEKEEVK